jgi:hypothetical protein
MERRIRTIDNIIFKVWTNSQEKYSRNHDLPAVISTKTPHEYDWFIKGELNRKGRTNVYPFLTDVSRGSINRYLYNDGVVWINKN